jgi:hypothetical protein
VTQHLVRHEFERLVAAESDGSDQTVDSEHLRNCELCAVRKRAVKEERSRYLAQYPSDAFVAGVLRSAQQPRDRRSFADDLARTWFIRRRVWTGLGFAASALVLLVWLMRPGSVTPTAVSTHAVRWKGGDALEVYVRHGGRDFKLVDGVALLPGDQLAFVYVISRPRYLLVLGMDDSGAITRYFPENHQSSARPLAAGRAQLPLGIELDSRRGQERLFAVFS